MKYLSKYFRYCCYLVIAIVYLFIIASGNQKNMVTANNVNNIKSIPATNLSMSNSTLGNSYVSQDRIFPTFNEALNNASTGETAFYGKLTGYGPDCKGCGGHTACRPSQNVKNGNIYYNDAKYGKVRILAADKSLPCGSIIKMNDINIYSEPIVGIVLDRGRAIKGNHLDLLFETEKNMGGFKTQNNIRFDIVRLGF